MAFRARSLRATPELRRIESLPRRKLRKSTAERHAAELTLALALRRGAALRAWQGQLLYEVPRVGGGVGALPVGQGKAQPISEPVLTPAGWRPIGELCVGDYVIGSAGTPVRVTGVYSQGVRQVARVVFTDGSWARCDYDHLWTFRNAASDNQVQTRTLREWESFGFHRPCGDHLAHKLFALPLTPVRLPERNLPLDPYTLGALLGDGCMTQHTVSFTTMDPDILAALRLPPGVTPKRTAHQNAGRATQYNLTARHRAPVALVHVLRKLGLAGCNSHTKFVPQAYLWASVEQRLALLQGLLDTDGTCAQPGGTIEYSTASGRLADAVCWLARSLGGSARKGVRSRNGNRRLQIKLPRELAPFRCARKLTPYVAQNPQRGAYRAVVGAYPDGVDDCVCIAVDAPDSLYVTRDCLLTHNTLPCELLPVVCKAKRAVLILPAGLRNKTLADRRSYAGVWRTASPPPRMISREELALDANAYLLRDINPDLIIIDEAHRLSNPKAAAVRRIDRFIREKRAAGKAAGLAWPYGVTVVALTGTLTRKTIMGYWHILRWCLGDKAPVPATRIEAEQWAAVLDEGTPRSGFRPSPGPLGATVEEARAWYLDRLEHTPGVMLIDEDSAVDRNGKPIPLMVRVKPFAVDCPDIDEAFDRLRTRWESPSGEPVTDALSLNRIEGQLGCGYYTYWKPPPPPEWLEARREVAAFIRKRIAETSHASKPLDTDKQVLSAHRDHPAVKAWRKVKHKFNPTKASRVAWLSDATVNAAARWIARNDAAGRVCVVWALGVELGKRIAKAARVPYYGREGTDATTGRDLHAADPKRSMVCSWKANMQGFNLQAWAHQGILQSPPSAQYVEQIAGRAHRFDPTFKLKAVHITILATSGGAVDDFRKALREARFAKSTVKNTQKILRADVRAIPELPEGLRWAVKADLIDDDRDT